MHITAQDVQRIKNIIECAQLELKIWTFLSPSQQQSLHRKIMKFQMHVNDFQRNSG